MELSYSSRVTKKHGTLEDIIMYKSHLYTLRSVPSKL